ncbi:MAG: TetR/AcrR family transcriptional regulator [Chloroflexota bacterium]|nr:TetR/AcrR family transcriptional regulator [Chloroflexota bacterium]MDE2856684.1 TetR/AcrR family transcriptional regulator [Chloroflexota bacterium]
MKKLDRRVLRTRQSLSDAMISLALEFGYEAITIKMLTERAGIGYATFFRHFKRKDDLLLHVLQSGLVEMLDLLKPEMTSYEEALITFGHIRKNPGIFSLFANLPRDHKAIAVVMEAISNSIKTRYVSRDESFIPQEVAINHLATSVIELVRWWIENDMKYSIEQMATIQSELIVKATEIVAVDRRVQRRSDSAAD